MNGFCNLNCVHFWNDGLKFYCKKYDNFRLTTMNMNNEEIDANINNTYEQDFEWYRARTYKTNKCINN